MFGMVRRRRRSDCRVLAVEAAWSRIIVPLPSGSHLQRRWLETGKGKTPVGGGAWMGVSGEDVGSLERNYWDESRLDDQRSSTMRIGLKYITPVLAAGAAAVAIAAAPAATAETTPAQPATIATTAAAMAPN